ncbi:SMI1/KNR4 family protein [Microbulbifer sp. JMSA003]|uniref:SMI1/KNR4 family protein n=1 Tax=unclassified Microbulbifer TaxID=2619833 RepID=UPI00403966F8
MKKLLLMAVVFVLLGCATNNIDMQKEKTDLTLRNSWKRIDGWLSENAPKIRDALNPPASEEAITELEETIGEKLPEDLKELYRIHNGLNSNAVANLVYGLQFYSIEEVILEYSRLKNIKDMKDFPPLNYADPGVKVTSVSSMMRIPIGDDSSGCGLFIDLDPNSEGKIGQIVLYDQDYNIALNPASSIEEMYSDFANHLEAGRYKLLEDALADGEHWLDADAELDIINWHNSKRWKDILGKR